MPQSFPVTYLSEEGAVQEWEYPTPEPGEALDTAMAVNHNRPGVYSVWDPEDRFGMPLLERFID